MEQPPKCKHTTMSLLAQIHACFCETQLDTKTGGSTRSTDTYKHALDQDTPTVATLNSVQGRLFEKVSLGQICDFSGKQQHSRLHIKIFQLIFLSKCEFSVILQHFCYLIQQYLEGEGLYLRTSAPCSTFAFCNLFTVTILPKSQMSVYPHSKASIPMMQSKGKTCLSRCVKSK